MRSESLLPIPVSTRTVFLFVRISSELSPAATSFFSSAAALRDHITLGTTPKNAPPSSGYVPSEKTLSSKSPSVSWCINLVCHREPVATDLDRFSRIVLGNRIRGNSRDAPLRFASLVSMQRPAGVTAISVLFFLAAIYLWAIGAVMLVSPGAISMMSGAPLMYGLELAGPYMALLVGCGWALIGWGLYRLHNWARLAAVVVMIVGVGWLVPKISSAELGPS